jgi:hypothetical protein
MRRGENLFKHGLTGTPEHKAWCGMMARCYSSMPGDSNYEHYRGAGVVVAERWHVFVNFLSDVGLKPSRAHSLDRFPNSAGNYEPGNVRWATAKEQANNWATRNRVITFGGETLSLPAWAARIGITRESLRDRLEGGWSVERALTTPPIRKRERLPNGTFKSGVAAA